MTTETKKASGLAGKMAAAMGEIGRVQKRGRNQAQGYNYARADDVAEEARRVLAQHGIAIFASVENKGIREFAGKNGPVRVSMVDVAWTFKEAETGEEKTVHVPGEGSDFGDKGIYKAMTGSLKYALMLGFLIPTGDGDPERDDGDDDEKTQRPSPDAKVQTMKDQLRDPKMRKVAVMKWFRTEYGEAGMRTKIEALLGRQIPKTEAEITLQNVEELDTLEKHRGEIFALSEQRQAM